MLLDIFAEVQEAFPYLDEEKQIEIANNKFQELCQWISETEYKQNIMSTLHHEDMLLQIFDEVQEAFPYLDEEKQIEIANNKFQELCQWCMNLTDTTKF